MTGETVTHYRVLRKLGGGGMGVVYEAEEALPRTQPSFRARLLRSSGEESADEDSGGRSLVARPRLSSSG